MSLKKVESDNELINKEIKQFVLMKEYYGSPKGKSPKKQKNYIQKTIIKEQVKKMEKDSLPVYKLKEKAEKNTPCKIIKIKDEEEVEEKNSPQTVEKDNTKTKEWIKRGLIGALAIGGAFGVYQYSKNN